MKKTIPFILLLSFVQCATRKPTSETPNQEIKAVVESEKLNVVYRGYVNPFTIYMPHTDSIQVKGNGVHKINNNQYILKPIMGNTMEITIIGYSNGKQIIDKRKFRILNLQKPYASIRDQYKTVKLTKEELANATIKVLLPQFVIEYAAIQNFDYQINSENFINNQGNEFSESAKKQISSLKPGDSVLIKNIHHVDEKPNICFPYIRELKIYIE